MGTRINRDKKEAADFNYDPGVDDQVDTAHSWGDIPQGTDAGSLRGLSINALLDKALFPTIMASIKTLKSLRLQARIDNDYIEVGIPTTIRLEAQFNEGRIQNGDGTNGPTLVGPVSQHRFSGPGISSVVAKGGNTLQVNLSPNSDGNLRWLVEVDHLSGTGDYFNNKTSTPQNNLDSYRQADTMQDYSPYHFATLPYFYGLHSTKTPTANEIITLGTKVVKPSIGETLLHYNMGSTASPLWPWFALPASPVSSEEKFFWYDVNVAQNKSTIGAGELFEEPIDIDLNVNGQLRSYKLYLAGWDSSVGEIKVTKTQI